MLKKRKVKRESQKIKIVEQKEKLLLKKDEKFLICLESLNWYTKKKKYQNDQK